jgi:2-methylcitrate dehydratase PrpD
VRIASPLTALGAWIQSDELLQIAPARFDRVKQHIVDTAGARIAGARFEAGAAASRFAGGIGDRIGSRIIAWCAHARSTEIDDIHLASCTTPGAVVVATALALASASHSAPASAEGDSGSEERRVRLRTVNEFCAATLAGYEALIRFGVALDGPNALHRGVWPTHAAAAFGAAATASRAYNLTASDTAGALATALAFGSGRPIAADPQSSSRWIALGIAAANGELAARAAREGLRGMEHRDAVTARMTAGLARRYLFDGVGMKPFATARQGLAAIEAAREIVARHNLAADDIDAVIVALPELQRRIVDRPGTPATRFQSIVSVQHQIALAIVAPDQLADVDRTPPFSSSEVRRLQSKIEVSRARDLDAHYPRAWPARVTIAVGRRRYARVVLHPRGDARRPLGWDEIVMKFERLAAPSIGGDTARRTVRAVQAARPNAAMPALWELAPS